MIEFGLCVVEISFLIELFWAKFRAWFGFFLSNPPTGVSVDTSFVSVIPLIIYCLASPIIETLGLASEPSQRESVEQPF